MRINKLGSQALTVGIMMALSHGADIFKAPAPTDIDDTKDGDYQKDHCEKIKKADNKRAMRGAKRLKHWRKEG